MIVAGTGHRPDKIILNGQNAYRDTVMERVVDLAVAALSRCDNLEAVIAGGALGFDEALATAAVRVGCPLRLYLPFPGYDAKWPRESRDKYARLRQQAEETLFVTTEDELPGRELTPPAPLAYGLVAGLLERRNRAMVDASDLVLSLWNGERKGGTWNCLRYAEKTGRPVQALWPSWERHAAAKVGARLGRAV